MYLQNKYTRWYYTIIQRAQSRSLSPDIYIEKHHIIPRSLGGNNSKSNLAHLLPREHFICHLLLTKMTEGNSMYKMKYALHMISNIKNIGSGRYVPSSRLYEYVRKCHHDAIKNSWTDEKRNQHSEKLVAYNLNVDKNSKEYLNRIEKIKRYQTHEKQWTDHAIQTRLENCLKNAAKRKGKTWSDKKRQSTLDTYIQKNLNIAAKIIPLHESGMNNLQISKKLGVSWDKVKYTLLHKTDFRAYLGR